MLIYIISENVKKKLQFKNFDEAAGQPCICTVSRIIKHKYQISLIARKSKKL